MFIQRELSFSVVPTTKVSDSRTMLSIQPGMGMRRKKRQGTLWKNQTTMVPKPRKPACLISGAM